jgi:para-nitrobenzyl esterase
MRFLPPHPVKKWTGIKDCTKNGSICVQLGKSVVDDDYFSYYYSGGNKDSFGVKDETQDENCLNLNILTPSCDNQKRAVLVYFHGGGFTSNSSTIILGAGNFVPENDIVAVGVNHRLNVFGYLHLGTFDKKYRESGMAGMLDLVLALEWVRDNIAVFGGDSSKVTIMGESGGAMKVSTLMAMPKAKGLFRHAIAESGSLSVDNFSIEKATDLANGFLAELGIAPDNLEQLINLKSNEILEAYRSFCKKTGSMPFQPVADEINLSYRENGFYTYSHSDKIPLMIGSSEDEKAIFIPLDEIKSITDENIKSKLIGTTIFSPSDGFNEQHTINESNIDLVMNVFQKNNWKKDSARHLYIKIKSMAGFLSAGAFYQAMERAKNGKGSVYHYVVAYDTPHLEYKNFTDKTEMDYCFAWHTAELPLQFGIIYYKEMIPLASKFQKAIAAFVKKGNPSTDELTWPAFSLSKRSVMVFDSESKVIDDPWREMRETLESI